MNRAVTLWKSTGTYLCAAGVGWGCVALMRGGQQETTAAKSHWTSSTRGTVSVATLDGKEILSRVMEENQSAKQKAACEDLNAQFQARVAELRKTLKPDADPAAAARAALDACPPLLNLESDGHLEAMAVATTRVLQWLESDPEAAVEFLKKTVGQTTGAAIELWGGELPFEQILARLKNSETTSWFESCITIGMSKAVGKAADPKSFEIAYEQLTNEARTRFVWSAISTWPKEKLAELLPYAQQKKDGKLCSAIVRSMPVGEAFRYLQELANTELGPEVGRFAYQNGLIGQIYANADVPLEQRAALMERFSSLHSGNPKDAVITTRVSVVRMEANRVLASADADPVMRDFADGNLSAGAALQQLSALIPDAARIAPEDLKQQLTARLLEHDPARGITLLDGMAPDERYRTVAAISRGFAEREPQKLLDLFQAVPFDPARGKLQDRFQVWTQVVNNAYYRYDDNFVTWVKEMPQGRDRNMALSALAIKFDGTNPSRAEELRALKTPVNNNTPQPTR